MSVVIPTRFRPELVLRAVRSVLSQTESPHEVVVVIDGPDEVTAAKLRMIEDPRLRVHQAESNGGPGRARNIGVVLCSSDWIAFLDDDDEWLSTKLADQCTLLSSDPSHPVVLVTAVERRVDDMSFRWPTRAPRPGERVADYLFVRRHAGEGFLATSTVLVPRHLALETPMPETLGTHEEWDWFLTLDARGAVFLVDLRPLVVMHAPRVRESVSAGAPWNLSLSWALARRADMSDRAFSAFCLTEVARAARREGGLQLYVALACIALTGRTTAFEILRFLAISVIGDEKRGRFHRLVSRPKKLRATRRDGPD